MQILVLGMRSGSSVMTRLINMLGASVGPEEYLLEGNEQNQKGFWESRPLMELNNAILKDQMCGWNVVSKLSHERLAHPDLEPFRERARALLVEMDGQQPWVLKDPRVCVLLPFWKPLLRAPVFVVIHRHPLEVAHSVKTHHDMPLPYGLALWERYTVDILNGIAGMRATVVSYNELLQRPVETIRNLHERLCAQGVSGIAMPDEAAILDFVDPSLYREKAHEDEAAALVTEAQQRLHRAALERPDTDSGVWYEVSRQAQLLLETYDALHAARWDVKVLRKRVQAAHDQLRAAGIEPLTG